MQDAITVEQVKIHLKDLIPALIETGLWQEMQVKMREDILVDLESVETPDKAFEKVVELKLLTTLFSNLEQRYTRD